MRALGVDEIVLTSLDVLGGFPKIRVAVAYEVDGKKEGEFPAALATLERARPVYEDLDGWEEEIRECRESDALPKNARRYVERLESFVGVPITKVSVGPDRCEIIHRRGSATP